MGLRRVVGLRLRLLPGHPAEDGPRRAGRKAPMSSSPSAFESRVEQLDLPLAVQAVASRHEQLPQPQPTATRATPTRSPFQENRMST